MARSARKSAVSVLDSPDARSGAYLAAARNAGMSWPAILEATGAKSAIPLRVVLRKHLAANPSANDTARTPIIPLPATPAKVREARDRFGEGFPLIAARTGVSVAKVRELYANGGGDSADGRVYVGSAGRTLVRKPGESTPLPAYAAAKRAKAKGQGSSAKATRKAAKATSGGAASPARREAARSRATAAAKRARKAA